MRTQYYPETPQPENPYPDEYYDPGLLNPSGFGQGASNPAPPLFLESLAVTNDLSVTGSQYVTQTLNAQGNIIGLANQQLSGNLAVGGPGSFGGVVSAAGFTYGGRSFFGANQFVVEAPATFLNSLTTSGAAQFQQLAASAVSSSSVAAQVLSVAPSFTNPRSAFGLPEYYYSPYYQPTDSDGNPIQTPIEFVPCVLGELPPGAVVLAYLPNPFRN